MNKDTLSQEHPDLLAQIQNEASAEARTAERTRIQSILDSESAAGREPLARHLAFATDMAADAAVAMLEKTPKEEPPAPEQPKTGSFDQVMRDLGNPRITPAANPDEEDADTVAKRVAKAA